MGSPQFFCYAAYQEIRLCGPVSILNGVQWSDALFLQKDKNNFLES